ncbi:MAG: mechanosensitive ion channel [Alphaproteobacteria bacterium]|nr:mechanosensitive ion channel [Alphaproteobacteria bacterium]
MSQLAGIVDVLEGGSTGLRDRLRETIAAGADLPGLPGWVVEVMTKGEGASPLWQIGLGVIVLYVAGWIGEYLYHRAIGGLVQRIDQAKTSNGWAKLGYLLLRKAVDLGGIAVFATAAFAGYLVVHHDHLPTRWLVNTLIAATVLVRLVGAVATLALSPDNAALRLAPVGDAGARQIRAWVMRIAGIGFYGFFLCGYLGRLGLSLESQRLLVLLVGSAVAALTVIAIWASRKAVAEALHQGIAPPGSLRAAVADYWHALATLYVLISGALWAVNLLLDRVEEGRAAVLSFLLVALLPVIDGVIERALRHLLGVGGQGVKGRIAHALPSIRRALRILLFLFAIGVLADSWGFGVLDFFDTPIGQRIGRAILNILVAVLGASVVWELIRSAIDRHMADQAGPSESAEKSAASRLRTLLPMMRAAIKVVLAVMVVLIVLSSVGVDIGPLLAGASVVGLAVGFGAQALVRDIVSGVFYLLDDAFRVGEYVEIGRLRGTVEAISIRSVRLRHHRGPVHTVPFGQIQSLTNYSRDWVIHKLELKLVPETDIDLVKKTIKRIGKELLADPEVAAAVIEPLKSQGVAAMGDGFMLVRCKVMTKPGKQFIVQREAFKAIQKTFAEAGIEFYKPSVSLAPPPPAKPPSA